MPYTLNAQNNSNGILWIGLLRSSKPRVYSLHRTQAILHAPRSCRQAIFSTQSWRIFREDLREEYADGQAPAESWEDQAQLFCACVERARHRGGAAASAGESHSCQVFSHIQYPGFFNRSRIVQKIQQYSKHKQDTRSGTSLPEVEIAGQGVLPPRQTRIGGGRLNISQME